jgi:uncharacterized membrane protein (DUF485 family)
VEDTGHRVGGGVDAPRGAATSVSRERWHEIANSPEFARVQALWRRITLGTLGVFVVAFGTFLILCGYARPFMRRSVDGALSVAYVYLLSLTVLAWVLVLVYLRLAERLSAMAQQMVTRSESGQMLERGGPETSERASPEPPRADLS